MRGGLAWILLVVFSVVSLVCVGCSKKEQNPTGKDALKWKKAKEGELSGEDAEKGE